MPTESITYEQLLAELEKKLRDLHKLPYEPNQRQLMQQGIIEFFYQLTKWHPEAARDVTALLERLGA